MLLKLPISKLVQLRMKHMELDDKLTEYEEYIDVNGLPYCDYRFFRSHHLSLKPLQKFQCGIRRIISILGSYKNFDIRDLMQKIKNKIKKEKTQQHLKRESIMLK